MRGGILALAVVMAPAAAHANCLFCPPLREPPQIAAPYIPYEESRPYRAGQIPPPEPVVPYPKSSVDDLLFQHRMLRAFEDIEQRLPRK